MTFTLTESLIQEILSALENQDTKFVVSASAEKLIELTDSIRVDEDEFYELPEWNSKDGFKLREDFVSQVRIPLVKEELQEILHSGRGVFKNFRLILKKYPEVEKKWHLYKNRIMQTYINQWYNELREIWGLERQDYLPESDGSLLHDDFTFFDYCSEKHKKDVLLQINAGFKEYSDDDEILPEELGYGLYEMWRNQFEAADSTGQIGIICSSLSEEFAGCITASPVSLKQEKVMILTSLFVPEHFRGLGIGTELLDMCLSELKASGKTWLILPKTIIPELMEPLLLRTGSRKLNSGYAVKLQ